MKNFVFTFTIILAVAIVFCSCAQSVPQEIDYDSLNRFGMPANKIEAICEVEKFTFTDSLTSTTLPYRLILPENYDNTKKYPVILYLHGMGENGTDNEAQLKYIHLMYSTAGDMLKEAILVAPQNNSGWFIGEDNTVGVAKRLLDNVIEEYSCDINRIYVMGMSMGGHGTWNMLESYPEFFAAAIPICGWGNSQIGDKLKNMPIWIYHGTADPTINISQSESVYNSIINAGGNKVKFTRLEGVQHDSWSSAFDNRELFCWLFAQNKTENKNAEYENFSAFRVVDHKGNTVITEKEILSVEYLEKDEATDIYLCLNSEGEEQLKAAFSKQKGKKFTVYFGSEPIKEIRANLKALSEYFIIDGVFEKDSYKTFCNTVVGNIQ